MMKEKARAAQRSYAMIVNYLSPASSAHTHALKNDDAINAMAKRSTGIIDHQNPLKTAYVVNITTTHPPLLNSQKIGQNRPFLS